MYIVSCISLSRTATRQSFIKLPNNLLTEVLPECCKGHVHGSSHAIFHLWIRDIASINPAVCLIGEIEEFALGTYIRNAQNAFLQCSPLLQKIRIILRDEENARNSNLFRKVATIGRSAEEIVVQSDGAVTVHRHLEFREGVWVGARIGSDEATIAECDHPERLTALALYERQDRLLELLSNNVPTKLLTPRAEGVCVTQITSEVITAEKIRKENHVSFGGQLLCYSLISSADVLV
mmetsp:Transcript_372/g.1257  ORF Transcript_372/g.1257 Transcript_372/m.1257 type:complete len:236 (+) Transcript_372:1459-2166(+)